MLTSHALQIRERGIATLMTVGYAFQQRIPIVLGRLTRIVPALLVGTLELPLDLPAMDPNPDLPLDAIPQPVYPADLSMHIIRILSYALGLFDLCPKIAILPFPDSRVKPTGTGADQGTRTWTR